MESDKTCRFSVSDKQKASYEEAAVNRNTKKSTETWLRTYLEWAKEKKKPKSIENLSPEDLDEVFRDFYTELKKKDSSDYQPESLGVMQASLDRYLKNKGFKVSIFRGREFAKSNKILKGNALPFGTKVREHEQTQRMHLPGEKKKCCEKRVDLDDILQNFF